MRTSKIFTAGLMACIAANMSAQVKSDRIDIYTSDSTFKSVMVNHIKSIKPVKGNAVDGAYETLNIATVDGTTALDMSAPQKVVYTRINDKPLGITVTQGAHARIALLDCLNNPDYYTGLGVIDPNKPLDWRGSEAGGFGHFYTFAEKGHAIDDFSIFGRYTGHVYSKDNGYIFVSDSADNKLGVRCYAFTMPFEELELKIVSRELTTYAGKGFLGEYKGIEFRANEGRINNGTSRPATLNFNANTLLTVKTTDANEFNLFDCIKYDDATGKFAYVEVPRDNFDPQTLITYGLSGQVFDDQFVYLAIHHLIDGKIDNHRYYFAGREGTNIALANFDDEGYRMLLESKAANDASATYRLIEYYGEYVKNASVSFTKGASIADADFDLIVSLEGTPAYRIIRSASAQPTVIARGSEAGTYRSSTGGADMVLDGFGTVTLGSTTGTYTLKGTVLTVVIGGTTTTYAIDPANKTYSTNSNGEWDGAKVFTLSGGTGAYADGTTFTGATFKVTFDQQLNGTAKKGTVGLAIYAPKQGDYGTVSIVEANPTYTYYPDQNMFQISGGYCGDGNGSYKRIEFKLHVSEDKQSLYIENPGSERIYKMMSLIYVDSNSSTLLKAQQ